MDHAAREDVHVYTDEELAELEENFAGTPFAASEDEPRTAAAANADEQARRARQILETRRYSDALGVAEVQTLRDLVDFLVAARVVLEQPTGELVLNRHAPLPSEVLPLDQDEVALQDELRWAHLHEGIANDLIRLFRPDDDVRVRTLQASLEDYAEHLGKDYESIRAAIESLISEGDFAADIAVDTVAPGDVFHLSVDWDLFARTRISFHRAD